MQVPLGARFGRGYRGYRGMQGRLVTLIVAFQHDLPQKSGRPHPPHPPHISHAYSTSRPCPDIARSLEATGPPTPRLVRPFGRSPHANCQIAQARAEHSTHVPRHSWIPPPGPSSATRQTRPSLIFGSTVQQPSDVDHAPPCSALNSSQLWRDFEVPLQST